MKNFKALYSIRRTHHGSVFPPDSHQAAGSIPYSSTTFPTISIYKAFSCIFPLHRHLPFLSLPDDRLLDTTTITTIYATATTAHIGALDLQPRDKFQISQNRKLNLSAQEFRQAWMLSPRDFLSMQSCRLNTRAQEFRRAWMLSSMAYFHILYLPQESRNLMHWKWEIFMKGMDIFHTPEWEISMKCMDTFHTLKTCPKSYTRGRLRCEKGNH